MNNENLEEILNNPNNILKIINELNYSFPDLYLAAKIKKLTEMKIDINFNTLIGHDPYLFYSEGHCVSYSEILCQIFGSNATRYRSADHVIVKIGKYFYDVHGLCHDISNFYPVETPQDLNYIESMFGIHDELEQPVEKELIKIGKEQLDKLKNEIHQDKTLSKTINKTNFK